MSRLINCPYLVVPTVCLSISTKNTVLIQPTRITDSSMMAAILTAWDATKDEIIQNLVMHNRMYDVTRRNGGSTDFPI